MSKPYIRKRTNRPFIHEFICYKCGEKCDSKLAFKKHWRESADHDQRVRL